jgi:TolB protein
MRRFILTAACVLAAVQVACTPLRQPIGAIAPGSSSTGTAGTSGTGVWSPSCDPAVFRCFQDPESSPSSPVSALFGGTPSSDPATKLAIVYPLDGAMHPINSADITFQWRRAPGGAQTVFRIRLQRLNGDVFEFFVPCNQPAGAGPSMDASECAYHMPPGAWLDAATTARGETLTIDLAGVDTKNPGTYAIADPISLAFSPEDLRGGLYYWSSAVAGTERLLFGARTPDPYIVHNNTTTNSCGGCHAVSRDGSTIAWEEGDTGKGVLWVASTAKVDTPLFPPATMHDCGIQAVNHDGTRVLVSTSGRLFLRDGKTGTKLFEVDETQLGLTFHAFHPEWSPDDQSIAVTVSANGDSDWAVRTGSIGVLPYNAGQFGAVQILVPTGTTAGSDFNFYPTWSPDGHFIAFATGKVGAPTATPPQTSYDQSTARLRLVNVDTKAIFELTAASGAPGTTSTWPKFAPFSQAGGLMFITFNSKMDYGFFPNLTNNMPQLWLTVIDPKKLVQSGVDPSRPPVWLPFQGVMQRNYASAWAATVGCRVENGTSIGCGAGEVCSAGACGVPAP